MRKQSAIFVALSAFIMICSFGVPVIAGSDDFVEVDQMPTFLERVPAEYPEAAKSAGIEGSVLVKSFIDSYGDVAKVKIAESSGNDLLDKAAVEAAKKCKFDPAIKDGKPVAVWIAYKISFKLGDRR